ncbi:unnamed protein product, partial [Rotaria sp. Silwood1]
LSGTPCVWRGLAYIMSKLTFNEQSLKGLLHYYDDYGEKLLDNDVYQSFLTILDNAKKNLEATPDLKVLIDALSTNINKERSPNGILIAVQQVQQPKGKKIKTKKELTMKVLQVVEQTFLVSVPITV